MENHMTAPFPHLQSPLKLGAHTARNRLAHASMTTRRHDRGRITDWMIRYFANRAEGGAAIVVTEPLAMIQSQDHWIRVQARDPANADGFRRWADAIAAHDSLLLAQIQHPGRSRHAIGRAVDAIGPSALPDDVSGTVPHALTADEIEGMIADYAESARKLQSYGFAGVEISGGHGHLFHQFLSPHSNRREDAYGGDWDGRTRLVREMIDAIRATCGSGFIIGGKLPGDDGLAGSIGPDEAAIIVGKLIGDGGLDYVCFAQGIHAHTLEMHAPDRFGPPMPYRELFARLRPACKGVPLMALGRITDPAEGEGLIAAGEVELVAAARALVADPAWLNKAAAGRSGEIRYCLSCNTCWGYANLFQRPLSCVNNPNVADEREVDYWPKPLPEPARKSVVVVGAGIAGMEAAWVAAARGHEVTVLSRGTETGGKARLRAVLPGGETLSSIYDYQSTAANRAGVTLRLGEEATTEKIMALRPDHVVLACGGRMVRPNWLPPEMFEAGLVSDLEQTVSEILRLSARQSGTAVIFDTDQGEGVYAAAQHLAGLFDRTVVITPTDSIATELWLLARQGILRRFSNAGIEVIPLSEPVWSNALDDGELEYRQIYTGRTGRIENLALLTFATPRVPQDCLAAPLKRAGIAVTRVGNCHSPQDLMFATEGGHRAGLQIGEAANE